MVGAAAGAAGDKYAGVVMKHVLDGRISAPQYVAKFANTKFYKILNDAASRGNKSLAATHFLLQQTNPEYRQMSQDEGDE
jgi:hypothetical protein